MSQIQSIPIPITRAADMNIYLKEYNEPFFLLFLAGDIIYPGFKREVESGLDTSSAGVIFQQERSNDAIPRNPVLWNTAAIRETGSGFMASDVLPFQHYTLFEKQCELANKGWSWTRKVSSKLALTSYPVHKWSKRQLEWSYIRPILQGKPPLCHAEMNPLISVVLCVYNDSRYMLWAVETVLRQTFSAWELIIINDGSTDETGRILRNLPANPKIRTFHNERNRGKAYCLNLALHKARGKWLLELDADDWLAHDCIEKLSQKAEAEEDTGVIYGNHVEWLVRVNGQLIIHCLREGLERFSATRLLNHPMPLAPRMYQIDKVKEIGGWNCSDPTNGTMYEDIQMLVRLSQKSPALHLAQNLYHRRLRDSSVTHRYAGSYENWKRWMAIQLHGHNSKWS